MLKKIFLALLSAIENHKAIRRFIILTLFPIWLWISYTLLMIATRSITSSIVQIYTVFTGVVATAVGFYFVNRNNNEKQPSVINNEIKPKAEKILDKVEKKVKTNMKKKISEHIENDDGIRFDSIDVSIKGEE